MNSRAWMQTSHCALSLPSAIETMQPHNRRQHIADLRSGHDQLVGATMGLLFDDSASGSGVAVHD
jgi:hypothetical protein